MPIKSSRSRFSNDNGYRPRQVDNPLTVVFALSASCGGYCVIDGVRALDLALLVMLAGCAGHFLAQREPWRKEAEIACMQSGAVRETGTIVRIETDQWTGDVRRGFPLRLRPLATARCLVIPAAIFGRPAAFRMRRCSAGRCPNNDQASSPRRRRPGTMRVRHHRRSGKPYRMSRNIQIRCAQVRPRHEGHRSMTRHRGRRPTTRMKGHRPMQGALSRRPCDSPYNPVRSPGGRRRPARRSRCPLGRDAISALGPVEIKPRRRLPVRSCRRSTAGSRGRCSQRHSAGSASRWSRSGRYRPIPAVA